MRKLIGIVALSVAGFLQGLTGSAQDRALDERLARGRNVALGFDVGGEFSQNPPSREDREALDALRQELERSRRYWIVANREDADLLVTIRVRWASTTLTARSERRDGVTFREAGSPKADVLAVYDPGRGQLGVPFWRGVLLGGLTGDRQALVARLLDDIDRMPKQR